MSSIPGLGADGCLCTSASVFHLPRKIVWVEENSASHRDTVRTVRSVLTVFPDNHGRACSSLIRHQNLTGGRCLKVRCNLKLCEWIFSFLLALKPGIGLFRTVTGSLTQHGFATSSIGPLKILVHWSMQIFQCWLIHDKHWKFMLVNIATNIIRKTFKCWEAGKLRKAETSFPEI